MKTDNTDSTRTSNAQIDVGGEALGEAVRHAQASLAEAGVAAKALADEGIDTVRKNAVKVEDAATRIGDRASTYVQEQPLKSLLIATAAGALIAIAVGMASRR